MLKDEQCKKLEHIQEQMSEELTELTAKLFEASIVSYAHLLQLTNWKIKHDEAILMTIKYSFTCCDL